jgi:hypothetical protein
MQNWCDYQFLLTAWGCEDDQRPSCTECTPRYDWESCAALGAECGKTYDGCGFEINCDQCLQEMPCGIVGDMDNQCIDLNLVNLSGTWVGSGSTVTIQGSHSGGYTFIGTNGIYKHQGTLRWNGQYYEGRVEDLEGWCCGNNGDVWLAFVDENTLYVTSRWYHEGQTEHFKEAGPDILTRQ